MSKTERRLEWADQLAPLIKADSEMGTFIDNGERPQTSRLVRWRANVRTVLDAIMKDGPDAPTWPEYNALAAKYAALALPPGAQEPAAQAEAFVNATPRPWHLGERQAASIIYAADGYAVADVKTYHHKHAGASDANAALIVTAVNTYGERVALVEALRDATARLAGYIGATCECDNTHEANGTVCCLCEYREALRRAGVPS